MSVSGHAELSASLAVRQKLVSECILGSPRAAGCLFPERLCASPPGGCARCLRERGYWLQDGCPIEIYNDLCALRYVHGVTPDGLVVTRRVRGEVCEVVCSPRRVRRMDAVFDREAIGIVQKASEWLGSWRRVALLVSSVSFDAGPPHGELKFGMDHARGFVRHRLGISDE